MDLNEYQKQATDNSKAPLHGDERDLVILGLGIGGEAGEVCDEIKKLFRDSDGKINEAWRDRMALELGDVLWYVSQIAATADLPLDMVAQRNISKIKAAKIARVQTMPDGQKMEMVRLLLEGMDESGVRRHGVCGGSVFNAGRVGRQVESLGTHGLLPHSGSCRVNYSARSP